MSDDPSPVDGRAPPDDARRLAGVRTLVNLDAVDFAPILAALKPLAEAARQCAGLIPPDGRIGSAGSRLLSQTAEGWSAFEAAIVGAGVVSADFATDSLVLTFDDKHPMAEQRLAIVYELWDLLSHRRRGRFDGADGLDLLAKQVDATAALVQALTSSAPPLVGSPVASLGAEQYVTLDQMAALVNRSKKTLERKANAKNSDMPAPDVEGGGGKPHEWKWSAVRPWLVKQFKRHLPECFPR